MWEWDPYSTDCSYGVHCTECILFLVIILKVMCGGYSILYWSMLAVQCILSTYIVHGTFSYSFYQCGGYSTYTGACWLLTVHTSFSFYQCGGYTVYSIPVLEHAGGTVHDMREGGHYKSPPAEKGQSHERKNTRNGEKHL